MSETADKLADALSKIKGVPPAMIEKARAGYFHDYESPLTFPELTLVAELRAMMYLPTTGPQAAMQLGLLISAVIAGEYDATPAEAEAWAQSPEGQATFQELMRGVKKRGKG
jgi:hypothetical protein